MGSRPHLRSMKRSTSENAEAESLAEGTANMASNKVEDVDLENVPPAFRGNRDMRSIRLADLPESVAQELKMLDVDESGTLSTSEIVESVRMYRESRRQFGIAMKIIIALCIFALIQIAAIVGTVWALLVKVKDTDTSNVEGQTTLTRQGTDELIHTGLATKIYSLHSDLPDPVLEQADRIRLTSPAGNHASFKVAAYLRITETDKQIVKIVLQDVGMVFVEGYALSFSNTVGDVLESAGFTTIDASGSTGRQLQVLAANHDNVLVSFDTRSNEFRSSNGSTEPKFSVAPNGVTILCPLAVVGEMGVVNGIEYTKRSREQITNANAATTCTSGVRDMTRLFQLSAFNGDISTWDTSKVTQMESMFSLAVIFDQDISHWDTSQVTNMEAMFARASEFDKDIGSWDTSQVVNMDYMFYSAGRFEQDLSRWCVGQVRFFDEFSNGALNFAEPPFNTQTNCNDE